MTIGAGISASDGGLNVLGEKILSDVHHNIIVTPASGGILSNGAFIGVQSDQIGSRRVFPVGKLMDLRFMCVFRFKLWWMTQRMGSCGQDIPFETQFLIVEGRDGSNFGEGDEQPALYVVFLPILEGDFRAVLQGNAKNELEICLESGDPAVQEFDGSHLMYVAAGSDPFDVITNAVKAVEGHLQTFSHRERKKMPDMLNWFGWCTWDAFYTNVTSQGIKQGLESFEKGGIPPKFVIIDDGWQSVGMDPISEKSQADNSANFANRLTNIKENHKFQKDGKEGERVTDPAMGIKHIVTEVKDKHSVKYVYVWHALAGYWGGVKPGLAETEHYEAKMSYPVSSPGVQSNEPCDALNSIAKNGLGLVNPEKIYSFYNELHSYLASAGIDGVKVDVQNILETLGAGHGGRVKLASKYHRALEASIARNFPDNGIISCSDKPGQHDFNLLRKLVLPDGSILRAKLPGRPTRDCLFSDPARDGKSLLKIWNLNDHNGVIGVFNCQGAGWCKVGKKNLIHDEQPGTITGIIRAKDVDYLPRVTNDRWNGDAVVYSHLQGDLVYLAKNASLPITLKTREYEVFTVVPVMEMSNKTMFAPIGLVKMFNSGGAIKELKYEVEKPRSVHMKVRGRGIIGAYSSVRPLECNC